MTIHAATFTCQVQLLGVFILMCSSSSACACLRCEVAPSGRRLTTKQPLHVKTNDINALACHETDGKTWLNWFELPVQCLCSNILLDQVRTVQKCQTIEKQQACKDSNGQKKHKNAFNSFACNLIIEQILPVHCPVHGKPVPAGQFCGYSIPPTRPNYSAHWEEPFPHYICEFIPVLCKYDSFYSFHVSVYVVNHLEKAEERTASFFAASVCLH